MYGRMMKPILDFVVAAAAMVAVSPLMAVLAVAVRVGDGGPALFRQLRIGAHGVPFVLLKFRTMPVDTPSVPSAGGAGLRVTPIGRLLRRTNLDELPQLINVLLGHMSLVGPRPALPSQKVLLALRRENGAARLRPGLTGLAQVQAYDGMPDDAKAARDGEYAARLGPLLDASIVLRTFGYLTRRPPVY